MNDAAAATTGLRGAAGECKDLLTLFGAADTREQCSTAQLWPGLHQSWCPVVVLRSSQPWMVCSSGADAGMRGGGAEKITTPVCCATTSVRLVEHLLYTCTVLLGLLCCAVNDRLLCCAVNDRLLYRRTVPSEAAWGATDKPSNNTSASTD